MLFLGTSFSEYRTNNLTARSNNVLTSQIQSTCVFSTWLTSQSKVVVVEQFPNLQVNQLSFPGPHAPRPRLRAKFASSRWSCLPRTTGTQNDDH